ncbi:hypothetical protein LNKW23_10180 [Paralimibaculum aggregatum]|uniref:Cytochrome c oxidase subunit IV bacterial aa3 type domain-containing protein n=1 Tax=Paralimibaculum aggregatum TaxID=3036245 RepID=A0ABQ6LNG7_9RHOB|nr:aa3-type cytochrome c oxidase subunit IV [Limibaculum sp. NKW23]GMG81805.1 hypothetical protein LNKW23_10180 [Limibaculum sp. NKW23]
MAAYQHGSQDPTPHQKVFEGFLKAAAIVAAASIFILIVLAFVGT